MFLLEGALAARLSSALSDEVLHARPGAGAHHVRPVPARPGRQLAEPLDQQHAGVADLMKVQIKFYKTEPDKPSEELHTWQVACDDISLP